MTLKYISHKYLSLQKTSAEETTRDHISKTIEVIMKLHIKVYPTDCNPTQGGQKSLKLYLI